MQPSESTVPLKLAPIVAREVRIVMAFPLCCTVAVMPVPPGSRSPSTEALPDHLPLSARVTGPLPCETSAGGDSIPPLSLLSLHPMNTPDMANRMIAEKLRKTYLFYP